MSERESCPCGGMTWTNGASSGTNCGACGRTKIIFNSGESRWYQDPAVVRVDRLEDLGRGHFLQIEKKLRRLDRLLTALTKRKNRTRKAAP